MAPTAPSSGGREKLVSQSEQVERVGTERGGPGGGTGCSVGRLTIGGVHCQLANVFVRVEHDDVDLGQVEAYKGHGSAQANCQAHGGDLNLANQNAN